MSEKLRTGKAPLDSNRQMLLLMTRLATQQTELTAAHRRIQELECERRKMLLDNYRDNYRWSAMMSQVLTNNIGLYGHIKDREGERIYAQGAQYYWRLVQEFQEKIDHLSSDRGVSAK